MAVYWKIYRPASTLHPLSENDKDLIEEEQDEILAFSPNFRKKKVLELGSGNGLFTSRLATLASHVTAFDFMQDDVTYNKNVNRFLTNVSFMCRPTDITEIDYKENSFDVIFSNWFCMNLSNDDMKMLFEKALKWLTPEGYLLLRESCFSEADNTKGMALPTKLRGPLDYCESLESIVSSDGSSFKVLRGKNLLTYLKDSNNPNQLCMLAKLVKGKESSAVAQKVKTNYSIQRIIMSERMYGNMWFSPGGESTNRDLCTRLALRPNQKVLDVGCGTGANAFFMARHYGVNVHGIDLSTSMIHMAIGRQGKLEPKVKGRVQFEINDIMDADFEPEKYDLIYSRDVILHVETKRDLFQRFYKWLKPGGLLFFTDFCKGAAKETKDFLDFMTNRGYTLKRSSIYCDELTDVGFTNVQSEDFCDDFVRILKKELESFVSGREAFVGEFSREAYDEYTKNWNEKIQYTEEGHLGWASFMGKK